VVVEQTESDSSDSVLVLHPVPPKANISPKGQDVWSGVTVLSPGRRIGPAEIGVLAAVGQTEVQVYQAPRVAIFTTGDEVVVPQKTPGPGQIRNSNSASLVARVRSDRAIAEDLGILPDEKELMQAAVRAALSGGFDLVLLTGGVSMGEKDLVGVALAAEGFNPVFHRINLKPGKPVLFGTAKGSLVFGLPGNPVSVAVTYEILVRPVLRYLMGYAPIHRPRMHAPFEGPSPAVIPREQYLPAKLLATPQGFRVKTVPWHGSADLFGFAGANALLRVPGGGPAPKEGDDAEVVVIVEDLSGLLAHGRR
jgi:molybdenum cofactor synthesis domain-containing protein